MRDAEYTDSDHRARDRDPYAAAKYRLTIEWIDQAGRLGDEIFNIGCGAGLFTAMAAAAGAKVRAFEPDPAAYDLAVANRPADCTVEPLSLSDIPGDHVAPVIVMHDVLEHISDDGEAIGHLHRLLAPDGLLVLSVPALPSLFGYHDEQLGHYRRYTKASLGSVLRPRFAIGRLRYFGMTFVPLTAWYSRIRRKPYSAAGQGALLGMFDAVCRVEQRIPVPVGTSLICLCRPQRELPTTEANPGTSR